MDMCYLKLVRRLLFCVVHSVSCTLLNEWASLCMSVTFKFVFVDRLERYWQGGMTSNCSQISMASLKVFVETHAGIGNLRDLN